MEFKRIEGIVVSERPYSNASKILDIVTKELGIISVISKGCKRIKSNLRVVSEIFTYASFEISYKKDKISTLISADIINPLNNIKKDIEKISYLNFISDLTKQVIKHSLNKNIYDIFINSILKINDSYDALVICNILELKYLEFLGVSPYLDGCVVCNSKDIVTLSSSKGGFVCSKHMQNEYIVSKNTIKIIRLLRYVDISKISKINLSSNIKKEINMFLDDYYDRYTGLYLKSKGFLKNIAQIK